MRPIDYARAACDTMIRRYAAEELPPAGRFYYHQGVFLSGMYQTWEQTGETRYMEYIRRWVDAVLDEEGRPRIEQPGELDDVMAGNLLYPLLDQTGEARYRKGIERTLHHLLSIPRTSQGAPWHKTKLPYQMWLDGLYMAGPFCAQYAARLDAKPVRDLLLCHIRVMLEHTRDEKTGLLYHAWDETKADVWADARTGRSSQFWGRSIGWVTVALLDDLDFLEAGSPEYEEIQGDAREILLAVLRYQSEDGRWYQVVDQGGRSENWLENSCSCLFTAALCKAIRKGCLGREWVAAARRGYEGVIRSVQWAGEDIQIGQVCVGTNVGDYLHYCRRPTHVNDLHGVGAFLLLCTQMQKLEDTLNA
jgi:unsaturated rhamnogalacturonyl hydrolase